MINLELRIPPVILVILFAVLMAMLARLAPAGDFSLAARVPVAVLVALAGIVVTGAGVVAFRRHQTTVSPLAPEQSSTLVTTGIYRVSRNPMYLGFLLLLAGWGVYLANWLALLALPGFVVYMGRFQIRPEERALRQRFGDAFSAYSREVRRWL